MYATEVLFLLSAGFVWLFHDVDNKNTFSALIRVPQGAAILVCSLLNKSSKRLAHDGIDTCASNASLLHNVTHTDYQ